MALDDPQDFAGRLHDERVRLKESSSVHERDRKMIERWLHRIDGRVTISTMEAYLRRCRLGSERCEVPLLDLTLDSWHDFVFQLRHEHELSDSTVQSYENAILLYLQEMTDAEWPDDADRTSVDTEGPCADDILAEPDIHDLITTARHQRDVAFIEFLADTGCRLSMALSLRVKDVSLGTPSTYTPNSKARGLKGADIAEYPLIDAAAAIRTYLNTAHPRPDNPDVALFHKVKPAAREGDGRWSDDGGVAPNAMRQQLSRIADRAGVSKPTNPHAFRHSAITRMVREGYSRSQIEHRVHWTLDTDMWETYEHITSTEHNDDIFREAGVLDPEDGPDRVRKQCGNCTTSLAPHHEFCPTCGQPSTPGASETVDEGRDSVLEELVSATDSSTRRELAALLEELDDRPDLAATRPEEPASSSSS